MANVGWWLLPAAVLILVAGVLFRKRHDRDFLRRLRNSENRAMARYFWFH